MTSPSHTRVCHFSLGLLFVAGTIHQAHSAAPSVGIERSNGVLQIHFRGTLESASEAEGPYQRVVGAVSPWTPNPSNAYQFWRASLPGLNTIAAGFWHTVAVRADGSLWTWGTNSHGQLGDSAVLSSAVPRRVGPGNSWIGVAAGRFYTIALRADGTLWGWGDNELGQLAQGTFGTHLNTPVQLGTATNWQSLSTGPYHVVALQEDESLWVWGGNPAGQLSNGSHASKSTPQSLIPEHRWLSAAGGDGHTLAVRADGTLWACGANESGQIGDGTYAPGFPIPPWDGPLNLIQVGTETNWASVQARGNRSVGIRTDGSVWVWGNNFAAQCGTGTPGLIVRPQRISEVPWHCLAPGESHTVAVRNGTLWMWGNTFGWSTNIFTTPQLIDTNAIWSAVATGIQHTVGLRADGTLWAWGYNSDGQLGNGSHTNCARPVQVPGGAVWGRAVQ
jgi:alpha-tubulin suppressor-like RCC1 family protein